MARKFLTAIDLSKNELQNAAVQNLAAAPSTPVKGQLYFDSTGNILYWYNGTAWVSAAGGSVAFGTITQEQTFGAVKSDGVATTAARSDHAHGNPTHLDVDHAAIHLNALAQPTTSVSMNGQKLINLADPAAATDAANKQYVDGLVAGLSWKDSVRVASTAAIASVPSTLQAIDGVTVAAGDRVLLKNQISGPENGIWIAASGNWTRATDADVGTELVGAAVFVEEGSTLADTAWVLSTNAPITIGVTSLTFAQFGSSTIAVNSVDNTKLADMPTLTVKGNDTGATADPKDLTKAAFATMFAGTLSRVVAANSAASANFVISHNLNTFDVLVEVYRNSSPFDTVDCDVERSDANNVRVKFAVAVAASEYRIVIMG